jgi:hypothetical protein
MEWAMDIRCSLHSDLVILGMTTTLAFLASTLLSCGNMETFLVEFYHRYLHTKV